MWASNGQVSWYALHTKPREENHADLNLRAWGVETFTPRIGQSVVRPAGRSTSRVIRALFPQYIFARFNVVESLNKIRFTRGVHSVVSLGGAPAPVHEDILTIIRARMGEDGLVRLDTDFRFGDRVVIHSGFLRGFMGVFDRAQNDMNRVAILLDTLRCQPLVIIERDRVRKAPLPGFGFLAGTGGISRWCPVPTS